MRMERKTIAFKVDGSVEEEGVFKGLGSGFGDVDQGNDMMVMGCFDESLSMKSPDAVKCLWQHNQSEPLGYYRKLTSTPSGLEVEGKIFPTTLGKDALILMKGDDQGKGVDGLSIGFIVEDYEYKTIGERRVRVIKKADLLEISVVTFPMHLRCRINGVKSMNVDQVNELESLSEIEDALRDLGLTKNAATALVSKVTEFKSISDEGEPQPEDAEVGEPQEAKSDESNEAHEEKVSQDTADLKAALDELMKTIKG
jgi:uncharacterized protein